jgi:hypothetical protein
VCMGVRPESKWMDDHGLIVTAGCFHVN